MLTKCFIAVRPLGSKFGRALQRCIKDKGVRKVFRVTQQRGELLKARGRNVFTIPNAGYDKLTQLRKFVEHGVSCPQFTTNAAQIGELSGRTVFARTLLNSTSGRGIIEFEKGTPPPRAPLYVEYIPKKAEFRVHIFNGRVLDVQQKKKRRNHQDERDTRVRNLANGYVYCRDGIVLPDGIGNLAIRACQALGMRYGAVDIIYNERRNQCFVLEVNSRPGLMGTTLDLYGQAVIDSFRS